MFLGLIMNGPAFMLHFFRWTLGFKIVMGGIFALGIVGNVRGEESQAATPVLNRTITELNAVDWQGREHQLQDFQDRKVLVVAFLGTECPLVKQYSVRLAEIREKYKSEGLELIGVNSNVQDSLEEIGAFARRQNIEFPLLKDPDGKIAEHFGATRTPEVFVLDSKRAVCYYGRIDDQFGVGYMKPTAEARDLTAAIDELLAGGKVSTPHQPATGCRIGRKRSASSDSAQSEVTFSNQIIRILQARCIECHRAGEIGPMDLTNYEEVAGWAEMIQEVIHDGRMPPWHASPHHGKFVNDRSLSEQEIKLIDQWVAAGAPEGDRKDLPEPTKYTEGWQLPKAPDLVVQMADKPFQVPARGDVRYQYFRVDPGFKEDKWLKAAEIQPSNRAVVHHVLVFVREKGSFQGLKGDRGFLVGYVPGTRVAPYPDGLAKRIPAGSELVFQVHYTPIGTPQEDLTKLGMIFAEADSIQYEVVTTSAVQVRLNIPPGDANYKTDATTPEQLPDSELLLMSPHMHLRGKAFRYTLLKPDGTRDILLDVPNYDFNWQTAYRLQEPLRVEAGSKMYCEAVFDNSEENLNNPDPSARVRWGDQTYEEMMIGYFDLAIKRSAERESKSKAPRVPVEMIQAAAKRWDKNSDKLLERSEVPERWHAIFERLDKNRDEKIDESEILNANNDSKD
jgi:peroxiredoxin